MESGDKAVTLKLDRNPRSVLANAGPVHGPPPWNQSPSKLVKAAGSLASLLAAESLERMPGIF